MPYGKPRSYRAGRTGGTALHVLLPVDPRLVRDPHALGADGGRLRDEQPPGSEGYTGLLGQVVVEGGEFFHHGGSVEQETSVPSGLGTFLGEKGHADDQVSHRFVQETHL